MKSTDSYKKLKRQPKPYWKYDLDVIKPYTATIKTPLIQYLEKIINDYHYGLHFDLNMMQPYKLSRDGEVRYKGGYYLTKLGKVKVRF